MTGVAHRGAGRWQARCRLRPLRSVMRPYRAASPGGAGWDELPRILAAGAAAERLTAAPPRDQPQEEIRDRTRIVRAGSRDGRAAAAARAAPPAPDPTDAVVTVEAVSRAFGDRVVVRDLDLTIRAGTILGVIGPSGSGKTTTIRMLTGALRPTNGDIRVLGERPSAFRRGTRERIGYMPQQFTLYPDLTARENVDFVGSLFGLLWRRRRRRVRAVLELLELWDARDRRASDMSGGMQRRLELACALVHEPVLLFLDEPTAGIDPILRGKVWDELHRLRDAGPDDPRHDAVRRRRRGVRPGRPDRGRPARRDGYAGRAAAPGARRGRHPRRDRRRCSTRRPSTTCPASSRSASTVLARSWRPSRTPPSALPAVVDAVKAAGGDVVAAQEQRPSFDEIFAILVERAKAETAAADADATDSCPGAGRMSLIKSLTRILAFVGKELVEVVRRPGALVEPHPRAVPDPGPLRRGLQRLPPAAGHGHRRPAGLRPADRRRGLQGDLRRRPRGHRRDHRRGIRAAAPRGPAGRRRPRRARQRRAAVPGRQAVDDPGPGQRDRPGRPELHDVPRPRPRARGQPDHRREDRRGGPDVRAQQGRGRGRRRSRRRSSPRRRRPRSTTSRPPSRPSSSSSARPSSRSSSSTWP